MFPWLAAATDRLGRLAQALLLLASAGAASAQPVAVPATQASASQSRVIAAVTVNGVDSGEAIWITPVDRGFVIDGADARRVGLTLPGEATGPIRIDRVPGITARFDAAEGVLTIVQRRAGADAPVFDISGRGDYAPPDRPIDSIMLNYDAFVRADGDGVQLAGFAGAVATTGRLTIESDASFDTRARSAQNRKVVRLDSRVSLDIPRLRMRATVGDVISRTGSFTRAVRLGGAQFTSDYSQRPDIVTTPLPGISASAAVPSGIDVLVNGRTLYSSDVEAGDFSLRNIPVVSGRNSVGVLVRDSLGRQTLQQVAIYASPHLLARGFSETSVEGGAVRYGYGTRSFDYRGWALFARHRRGLNDRLTIDAGAEAGDGVMAVNAEASVALGGFGLLTVGGGASRAEDASGTRRRGGLWALGFESFGRGISVAASIVEVSRGYRDVASMSGQSPPRSRAALSLSHSSDRLGSFSIAAVRVSAQRQDNGAIIPRARLVTGYYSRRLSRSADFHLSYSRDFDQRGSGRLLFGITASFSGGRSVATASAAVSRGRWDAEASVQRSAFETGDVGYRASIARGALDREAAGLTWLAPMAQIDLAAERIDKRVAARLSASGTIVIAGGDIYAARRIDGGFAIVDTGGIPAVGILQDNRPVGRTSASGRLLVTGLRPYESNRLSVDLDTLPPTAVVDAVDRQVRPALRAGIWASMGVRDMLTVSVSLVDEQGTPLPRGSAVHGDGIDTLVGTAGRLLLEIDGRAVQRSALRIVALTSGNSRCTAELIVPTGTRPFADLGMLTCTGSFARPGLIASATRP